MRFVLVDHARKLGRAKRDGIKVQLELVPAAGLQTTSSAKAILSLDEAFKELEIIDPLKVQVAEMKCLVDQTIRRLQKHWAFRSTRQTTYWQFARSSVFNRWFCWLERRHKVSSSLLDTKTWKLREKLKVADAAFISISFSPDNKQLVTGDDEGTVRLWSIEPLRQVALLGRHSSRIKSCLLT